MSTTYRLTNGKKKGFWQLPIRNQTALKEVKTTVDGKETTEFREKPIVYVRGSNSIFIEDQEKVHKAESVWFEDGDLIVADGNWTLNQLITNHKMFNVFFEKVDEEKYAAKKVDNIKRKNKVQSYILDEPDNYVIKAMAMTILGAQDAAQWGDAQCREKLLEYSENHTQTLIDEMDKPGYENRIVAATAYNAKIVKDNATHTAVIWGHNNGVIVHVVQGENGVDKLGAFFSEGSEAAILVMQEIGRLSDKSNSALATVKEGLSKPGKSEAEIRAAMQAEFDEKLQKGLADIKASLQVTEDKSLPQPSPKEREQDGSNESIVVTTGYDATDIAATRAEYKRVLDKQVPPNMNQNLDWMNEKIEEANTTV